MGNRRASKAKAAEAGRFLFLEAGANWADRERVDLVFVREDGRWRALMRMSDARGPYQAAVEFFPVLPDEGPYVYRKRVARALSIAHRAAIDGRAGTQ